MIRCGLELLWQSTKQTHSNVGSPSLSQRIEVRHILVNHVIKEPCEPGSSVCVHIRAFGNLGWIAMAHSFVVSERATRALV